MSWLFSSKNKKNVRVKATPGQEDETYVTVSLSNSFDFLQVLSLKLSQGEVYRLFDSSYGVVAGRVIGSESVGIPNCRISLFVPKEELSNGEGETSLQRLNSFLVDNYYPYETVSDTDGDGRRYNLLTNQSKNRGYNGFPENDLGIGYTPKTPVGTFPEKEELLTNEFFLTVYEKYYKFTTVTNESGDYMIFGVPTGTYTLHMDCDVTDIGRWSITPAIMTRVLGYPQELFEEDGTKILAKSDLSLLPNVQTQNIAVTVLPFWTQRVGAKEVGITRQDIKLPIPIIPSFTLFGNHFTMAKNRWWGDSIFFRLHYGWKNICFSFGSYDPLADMPYCNSKLGFAAGINFDVIGLHLCIGNACSTKPNSTFYLGFGVQIANKLPFLSFEFGDNPCRLDGGKYDSNAFDLINHGDTCKCTTTKALEEVPDSGITDGLFLNRHRAEMADIKLFSLKPSISDTEAVILDSMIRANTTPSPIANNALLNRITPESDIEFISKGRYAELLKNGLFVLQIPTNRRRMITDEEGNLVDSPRPDQGVFTEFRGYLYMTSDGEFDSPDGKDKVGRISLKIPQAFDYDGGKSKEWAFSHGLFKAGEIYSVAQKFAVRNSDFSSSKEKDSQTFNGGGIDVNTGDVNDPNLQNSDDKGWDNQTGLVLFTKDPKITLNLPIGWVDNGMPDKVMRNGVNGLPDYTQYPTVQYALLPTHLTSIGQENSYKVDNKDLAIKGYGASSSENKGGVNGIQGVVTNGVISNPTTPVNPIPPTFTGDGYAASPLRTFSENRTVNFTIANWPGLTPRVFTPFGEYYIGMPGTAMNNSINGLGLNDEITIKIDFRYSYLLNDIRNIFGVFNWRYVTNNGDLDLRYFYTVNVAFIDTGNMYNLTENFEVGLFLDERDGNEFRWKVTIPALETAAATAASRTSHRIRLRVIYNSKSSLYFWTPVFNIAI